MHYQYHKLYMNVLKIVLEDRPTVVDTILPLQLAIDYMRVCTKFKSIFLQITNRRLPVLCFFVFARKCIKYSLYFNIFSSFLTKNTQ